MSDHKLIRTSLLIGHNVDKGQRNTEKAPISDIAIRQTGWSSTAYREEHQGVWAQKMGQVRDPEKLHNFLNDALCEILDQSKVGKFLEKRKRTGVFIAHVQQKIDKLNKERVKLDTMLARKGLTRDDAKRFEESSRSTRTSRGLLRRYRVG